MNKKFSTLMAGLVLASGVATAQHAPSAGGFPYRTQDVLSAGAGTISASVQSGTIKNAPYYQLSDGAGSLLIQVRDQATGELTLKMVDAADAPLIASLWSVKVNNDQSSGKQYTFVNKETGVELVFDHKQAIVRSTVGAVAATQAATRQDGCTMNWAWSDANNFTGTKKVYSAFDADSVMVMQTNGTDGVVAVKYSNAVAGDQAVNVTNALSLQPVIATGVVLKASDINSMIDAYRKEGAEFKFNKNGFSEWETITGNVLADNKYVAETLAPNTFAPAALTNALTQAQAIFDDVWNFRVSVVADGATAFGPWCATEIAADSTALEAGVASPVYATRKAALIAAEAALGRSVGTAGVLHFLSSMSTPANRTALGSNVGKYDAWSAKIEADILKLATLNATYWTNVEAFNAPDYNSFNIRLAVKDDPAAKYYMVDTLRNEDSYSTVANMKLVNKPILSENPFVLARYNFKLTYFASNDSLFIEPLNASSKSTKEWNDAAIWGDDVMASGNCLGGKQLVAFGDIAANNGIQVSNTVTNAASTDYADKHVSITVAKLASNVFVPTTAAAATKEFKARISFVHEYPYLARTSFVPGAYYAKLVTKQHAVSSTNRADGQYLVANMNGTIVYDEWASTQNFEHMPATQWVIETLGCEDAINPRVKITNREYDDLEAFEGQLYKAGKDTVYFINHNWNETNINNQAPWDRFSCQDTIMFVAVKNEKDAKAGYLALDEDAIIDQSFMLKHFTDYGDQYLKALVGTKDTLLNVAKDGSNFELVMYTDSMEYGKSIEDVVSPLHRILYTLKVKDFDKVNNDQRFIGINKEGNYCVIDTIRAKTELAYPAYFYLKENDHKDDNHGYALVNANGGFDASGVRVGWYTNGADKLFVENKSSMAKKGLLSERQTDVFFMVKDTMPYYKRMAVSAQDTVSFFDAANSRRVLIEDHNSVYSNNKGAGFLGFRSLDEAPALKAAPSMYVDTAYVRNDTRMPLYLLAVGAEHKATKACDHAFDLANPGHSAHFGSRPYIQGRYLVDLSNNNLVDKIPYIKAKDAVHEGVYTRQAFVNAIHMGDSVYILKDTLSTYEYEDSIKHYAVATLPISAEAYNGATVSFRLKDQDNDENFYIEMNGKFAGFAANGGAWIKNQNNVSVLATASNEYYLDHNGDMVSFAQEDIYQGTVFTMKKSTENPTDNEVIETSEVSVIGGTGNVQIAGAEGKRVTISNILGQAIANTVISSSDATIAVPAGIVVVAVEGEAAVKAIIK